MPRVGDLEIDEDLGFQRKMWIAERIGWGVMLLLILAAFLGTFGGRGPLADSRVSTPGDALRVEFKRLARHQAPSMLTMYVAPGVASAQDSTVSVWIDWEYLKGLNIDHITPEPESVQAGSDRTTYEFKVSDPARFAAFLFTIRPGKTWTRRARIGLEGGPSLRFSQFVFP